MLFPRMHLWIARLSLSAPRLWWNAWRDARRGTPSMHAATPSQTERLVVDLARLALRTTSARLAERARMARARQQQAQDALRHAEAKLDDLAATSRHTRPTSDRHIPPLLRWSVLMVLGLVDAWFNKTAFDGIDESGTASVFLALTLGVTIPLVAHVFGLLLRQERWTRGGLAAWSLLLLVVGAMLWGTAGLRVSVPSSLQQVQSDISANVIGGAVDVATSAPIDGGPSASKLYTFFLITNVFVFTLAVFVGAYGTDSRAGFDAAERAFARARRHHARATNQLTLAEGALVTVEAAMVDQARSRIRLYRLVHGRHARQMPRYFDDADHAAHDPAAALIGSVSEIDRRTPAPASVAPPLEHLRPFDERPMHGPGFVFRWRSASVS